MSLFATAAQVAFTVSMAWIDSDKAAKEINSCVAGEWVASGMQPYGYDSRMATASQIFGDSISLCSPKAQFS